MVAKILDAPDIALDNRIDFEDFWSILHIPTTGRALVLHAYIDESGTDLQSGVVTMCGFAGTKQQWQELMEAWRIGRGRKQRLHMSKLRFKKDSEREMLQTLGPLPHQYGLQSIGSFLYVKDYRDIVEGRVQRRFATPYMILFQKCLFTAIREMRRQDERIGFAFEEAANYRHPVSDMWDVIHNLSIKQVISIATIRKDECEFFEPADYLAFATHKYIVDQNSTEAQWTLPIFGSGYSPMHSQADRAWLQQMVNQFRKGGGGLN
jgi:hypothetical protein